MKRISFLLITLYTFAAHSQTLGIGETIPDNIYHNIYNSPENSFKLSDFKGKFVLLEFWGFRCIGCVEGFPKLAQLQKDFDGQLQIILVNSEKKSSTDSFFKKRVKVIKPNVPFITQDTFLHTALQTKFTPANVWLDRTGKIIYLAEKYNANHENIRKLLEGQEVDIPLAKPHQYTQSFFSEKYRPLIESYYYISKCIDGVQLEPEYQENEVSFGCRTPVQMYQDIFTSIVQNQVNFAYPGRTIIQNYPFEKIQIPIKGKERTEWYLKNGYNFHMACKDCNMQQNYEKVIRILDEHFHLRGRIEKRKVNGWSLISIGNLETLKTKGGLAENHFYTMGLRATSEDSIRFVRNQPFQKLVDRTKQLTEYHFGPFQNCVKFAGNIDFRVDDDILENFTIASFKKELNKYGLDLVEAKLVVDVLIINGEDEN